MSEQPLITQETFQESPYVDQSWEIVGEPPQELVFSPMEVEIVGEQDIALDPMFRDYGGRPPQAERRWHLPPELASEQERELAAQKKEAEVDHRIKIEPAELERIKQEAHAQGQAAGRAEAEAKQQQQLAQMAKKIEILLHDFKRQLDEGVQRAEQSALKLALEISQKLVGHAVEVNPEYVTPIIHDALRLAGGATIHRVRVSPEDLEFIEIVGIQGDQKTFDQSWKFEKDETIKAGCVVETSAGEIDFQLDKAWERIEQNVLKVIR